MRVAMAVVAVCATACSSTVSGDPKPAAAPAPQRIDAPLSSLLLDPAVFPARYSALVLPPQAVAQAAADLTGVATGATVAPDTCKPPGRPTGPDGTAMVVGTDNASRATISVELTRSERPLSVRRAQLADCGEMTVTNSGATSTVRTELLPPPTVRADDSVAIRQTVASASVQQTMTTLLAQVGDVRIASTFMTFRDTPPDTATLDEVFTKAVQRVHAG